MKDLTTLGHDYVAHRSDVGRFDALRRNTVARSVDDFTRWLATAAHVTRPDRLSLDVMQAWFLYAVGKRCVRTGLPQQRSSIYFYGVVVKGFCRWLRRYGFISEELLDNFPRFLFPPRKRQMVLRHDAVRQFLEELPLTTPGHYQFRALAEFLYTSGARLAEAAQLDLADVDLAQGKVRVTGKGQKQRMVPIGRTARHYMEIYLSGVRPLRVRNPSETAFWLAPAGTRLGYHSLRGQFRYPVSDEDARKVHPHVLRRSCATEMIRGGANVWAVKDLLGHEDLETIEYYALLDLHDLKQTHARCHPRDRHHTSVAKSDVSKQDNAAAASSR